MEESSSHELILDVASAASSGPFRPDCRKVVHAALVQGKRAAEQGRGLPLPVLLDAFAVLSAAGYVAVIPERGGVNTRKSQAYDRWLSEIRNQVYTRRRHRDGRTCGVGESDFLPLLLHAWPEENAGRKWDTLRWAEGYRTLLADDGVEKVSTRWAGRREADPAAWTWCPDGLVHPADDPRRALLWSEFSLNAHEGDWPERFDHGAGCVYLDTLQDVELLPDQRRRIHRLKCRTQQATSVPLTTSIEHQDPRFGILPYGALVGDNLDEIAMRIINHEINLLNERQRSLPRRTVTVHLCWMTGYAAVTSTHDNLYQGKATASGAMTPGPPQPARLSHASSLQGFMALLLDDFRHHLRGLPVRFHLHLGYPEALAADAGKPGRRWKETSISGGRLPPTDVAEILFERRSHVQMGISPVTWHDHKEKPERSSHVRKGTPPVIWRDHDTRKRHGAECWCLCLCREDCRELGMSEVVSKDATSGFDRPHWRVRSDRLPDRFKRVIILDPPPGGGIVCRTHHAEGTNGHVELWPMTLRAPEYTQPDLPFFRVRCTAMDALLEQLEEKL